MKDLRTVSSALRCILPAVFLFGAAFSPARADVVTEWNVVMTQYSENLPPPGMPPFVEARIYAMTHLAIYKAITDANDVRPRQTRKPGTGNAEAAAAAAAHAVLIHALPGGTAAFDSLLATQLAAIPAGAEKNRGIEIGLATAANVLASRSADGSTAPNPPYVPGNNPGDYQFTPPFDGPPFNGLADAILWGKVTPFALKSGSQFRAPPPSKVTDLRYTFDFNEIKALGSYGSTARTEDQTKLAIFWYENSSFGWNRVARLLAQQHSPSLLEHARLFALLNVAIADAYISSLESKYAYNFWRPITAIRLAATDGNDLTAADATWEPLLLTPPVPDYPSAHACAGGAASVVLASLFGGDQQAFELGSTSAPPDYVRSFSRISDAAKENALSRMFVGIHFREACLAGLKQGQDVGTWVLQRAAALER